MALDLDTAPGPSPMAITQGFDMQRDVVKPQMTDGKPGSREYFDGKASNSNTRKIPRTFETNHNSPPSGSPRGSRHSSQPSSPHIAYQEIGRDPTFDVAESARKRKDQSVNSIAAIANDLPRDALGIEQEVYPNSQKRNDHFLLQEVPKSKRTGASARSSKSDGNSSMLDTSISSSKSKSAPVSAVPQSIDQPVPLPASNSPTAVRQDTNGSPHTTQDSRSNGSSAINSPSSYSSPLNTQLHNLPQRHDSLARNATSKESSGRRGMGPNSGGKILTNLKNINSEDQPLSAPPAIGAHYSTATGQTAHGNKDNSRPIESPSSGGTTEIPDVPQRARERNVVADSPTDSFVTPRQPPRPPVGTHKPRNESVSTLKSDSTRNGDQPVSPRLPRYTPGGDLNMEDDMTRILGNEDHPEHPSFLHRLSSSVHKRSYSDRGTRLSREPKGSKSPLVAAPSAESFQHEFSSPTSSSTETREELNWYKNEVRREKQKTAERDQRIQELEAALEAKNSIKQMNSELREKRSTMVVLDTQKEIVVRELEVLTKHLESSQKSGEPLDIANMSNMALRDFAAALQKLKDSFAPQIEDLTQTKNDLADQVANLTQLRDKVLQEFEQLSLKNAQVAELNNHLVHQIQEMYKANATASFEYAQTEPKPMDNGDTRRLIAEFAMKSANIIQEQDAQPATLVAQPQVININKPPKKFNWKKGGQTVAKGVTKGIKGAFTSNDQNKYQRDGQYPESMPFGSTSQMQDNSVGGMLRSQSNDAKAFGFFGAPKSKTQSSKSVTNGNVHAGRNDGASGMIQALLLLSSISLD